MIPKQWSDKFTCKKSLGVAPSTCKILSYPESWQNSKNVLPNNSKISSAGISVGKQKHRKIERERGIWKFSDLF